ncbi:alpha/beta fold hydrolase (plasmid) [Pseudorhodobacter turbinis]|uniref:Alpha/beta fold hydrolase n=1 Tax=Pseudorhodobacter turbinis TaxID=2500533 RepID=A0A4P8ELH3_9RHOB|nr:alpha/beta fold hydrolase [Pseudorhodobacter turbinis]QCO57926.1 alpha/beta fold hydrolase [Pseudorhodobacter turbinis]
MLNIILHPAQSPSKLPPLLIVHGLFGSARNWGVIARRMAADREVLAVDMRNHGESPWMPSHSYADMAADLAEVIAAHGGRMDVMGHSMGGKAAMQLALTHGDMVDRLIVADIAPVAYSHDQSLHIRAMRALDLTGLTARSEADRRLAAHMDDPSLRAFFLQSLDLKADPVRWRLNLDVLEAEMAKITGWPGTTGRFDGAALFLAGGDSTYILPEHRPAIRDLFPAARFAKIPNVGHWLHAEKPREFEETMRIFLAR